MRRLSQQETGDALKYGLSYPVFMAIAEKIGHDKRGKTIFKRDPDGKEILVSRKEVYRERKEDGSEAIKETEVKDRLVDDELPDVATAYLKWLGDIHEK